MLSSVYLWPLVLVLAALAAAILTAVAFRVVVSTNDVHIVQSAKTTVSYGKGLEAGNTYYAWPSWVPVIGVKTIRLPVSVFDQSLDGYSAYDKGRVPFVVDVVAFFRITDSNVAAQRIDSFDELRVQLKAILQGAIRTILASSEIETILEGRSEFGVAFTREVDEQLTQWGVQTVKTIELMDIRDAEGSKVIQNIMAKKKSLIDMESRVAVAENSRAAETAEIEARRAVEVSRQEAEQLVGVRTAEKERDVGVATQRSVQTIRDEERITAEKSMAVQQVNSVRSAEIDRDVELVKADREKRVTVTVAQGDLERTKLTAQGIVAEGKARADAERAMQLAPVEAQLVLAREIGSNESYQRYLVSIRTVEASQVVGVESARALQGADVKVISTAGDPSRGVGSIMEAFTPAGGTAVGAMLEALSQTPVGKAVLDAVVGDRTTGGES